jgi:CRISPR/Cas system CSM-associated protein Csm3 (group 7 of RAMP superfamily)
MKKYVFKIKTVTPLYTGEVRVEDVKVARNTGIASFFVRKTNDGRVIIPLKGALRGTLEKILPLEDVRVCNTGVSGAKPCGKCILCEMFGSLGKKGLLTVDFLLSEEKVDKIVKVSAHVRLSRTTDSVSDTFKAEEVIEGATFSANIIFHSFKEEYLKLIQKAIEHLALNGLGGWTNKGYGRFEYTFEEAK